MWEEEAGRAFGNDDSCGSCGGTWRAVDAEGAGEVRALTSEGSPQHRVDEQGRPLALGGVTDRWTWMLSVLWLSDTKCGKYTCARVCVYTHNTCVHTSSGNNTQCCWRNKENSNVSGQ